MFYICGCLQPCYCIDLGFASYDILQQRISMQIVDKSITSLPMKASLYARYIKKVSAIAASVIFWLFLDKYR